MVAFHDRRQRSYERVEDIAPGLNLGPGDSLSKNVLDGRFVVQGYKTEEGRRYSLREVLPSGQIVEHARDLPTRYAARKTAKAVGPTQTYDINTEHQ